MDALGDMTYLFLYRMVKRVKYMMRSHASARDGCDVIVACIVDGTVGCLERSRYYPPRNEISTVFARALQEVRCCLDGLASPVSVDVSGWGVRGSQWGYLQRAVAAGDGHPDPDTLNGISWDGRR